MILLLLWRNVDKATWLRPHATSLMLTFTRQQIPHGVTQLNDKSALVCQRTVVNVNCLQWAYLSHWAVLWYTTASSDDNSGVKILSHITFLSKYAPSKLTPQGAVDTYMLALTWSVSASVAFCLCWNVTTVPLTIRCSVTRVLLHKYSVRWSAPQTVFISALLMRSGQNILMKEDWDVFFSRAQQHWAERCSACVTQRPSLHDLVSYSYFSHHHHRWQGLHRRANQTMAAVNQWIRWIQL